MLDLKWLANGPKQFKSQLVTRRGQSQPTDIHTHNV